jgi:hypothetical protein
MELRKIILAIFFVGFISSANAEIIKPAENLSAYDVIKIQLNALKNNDDKDNGIKQTWIFAHPDNKKMTGPYPRFRIMLYDVHYRILLNHFSHKIDLIMNTENKFVYGGGHFKNRHFPRRSETIFYHFKDTVKASPFPFEL